MDAIYARQSIDKKDSLSIEGQIEQCRRCAGEDAKVYQDKGFSGKNTKRPDFQEMIRDIEAGRIQKVIVYRLDRFSRSIMDFGKLWELLKLHNVEFLSVTEHFDTSTSMGRAMLNIVLVFAQLERETTAERVKDNYIHRFTLGAWPGGPAPYGYDLNKIDLGGRRVSSLKANPQAEVVRRIFEEYDRPETSLRSIARELTAQGIHGPKREAWDNVTLSRILHSPIYVRANEDVYWYYLAKGLQIRQDAETFDGVHACNVIGRRDRSSNQYNALAGQLLAVANHEGFIDAAQWLRVQEKLDKNPQISRSNAGKYSWLTGLMKCGKCGYAIKINYSKPEDRFYLVCSGRSNLSSCDATIRIDLRELERRVAAELKALLDSCPMENICPDTREASAEILAIEQKIERLVNALAESSEVSAGYISKQIDKLHREREALLSRTASISSPGKHLDLDTASFEEKKLIAAEFIDRILLDEKSANIIWKV